MRGTSVNAITLSPQFSIDNVIFIGTASEGLFYSSDGGETWETVNSGFTSLTIMAITLPPAYESGSTVFIGTSGGVYRGAGVEPDPPFVPTTGLLPQTTRTLLAIGLTAGIIVLIIIPIYLIRLRRRVIDRRIAERGPIWSRDIAPK
jgi:hypothetical protein